jgi:5'-nucleotidase
VETANTSSPSANVSFDPDYAVVAQAQIDALKAAGCDTIIALTHIGYDADLALAPKLRGLHLIVGGHSHTPLLSDAQKDLPFGSARVAAYPQIVADLDGNTTVVVQDWEWAKWIGDITVGFDATGLVSEVVGKTIQPVWATGLGTPARALITGEGAEVAANTAFQTKIDTDYAPAIATLKKTIIGATLVDLPQGNVRASENALANFLADSFRDYIAKRPVSNPNNYPVVAIINGGGVRTSISAGAITVAKLIEVQPFGNQLCYVDLTGAQIKAALENGVSALTPGAGVDASRSAVGTGRFPQVSGLRYTIIANNISAQVPYAATGTLRAVAARAGNRIAKIEVLEGTKYVAIDPAKTYRVVTNNFMLTGGDGYTAFTPSGDLANPSVGGGKNQTNTFLIDTDVTQDYLKAQTNATISPQLEGRITVTYLSYLPQVVRPAAATAAAAAQVGD